MGVFQEGAMQPFVFKGEFLQNSKSIGSVEFSRKDYLFKDTERFLSV